MKKYWYFAALVFGFAACKQENEPLKQRISGADSIAINFFRGDGTMDTVTSVKIIRNKQQIVQLAGLVSDEISKPNFSCGFDGSLHFFKMNKVIQDIDFRMEDENCMYFTFMQSGKHEATKLSPAAKALLQSFK